MQSQFNSIGIYHGSARYKFDAPRQGSTIENILVSSPGGVSGYIELHSGQGYELALRDLAGFGRIWIVYQFHHNAEWKPLVRPPLPPLGQDRVGVFASRSPYRPNPIGLCAAKLVNIQGLRIDVVETDLLDQSPILDIKPYLPEFDAFPDEPIGWVARQKREEWTVIASQKFMQQEEQLIAMGGPELRQGVTVQLSVNPFDDSRKRVRLAKPDWDEWEFAYRTWRIAFIPEHSSRIINLVSISSGYSTEDLALHATDIYGDKELHRNWKAK